MPRIHPRDRRRTWRDAQRRPAAGEPARCFANRCWKSTTCPPSPFTDSGTAAPEVPEISEINARASRISGARLSNSAYSRDARVRSSSFLRASSSSNASAFFAPAFFFATTTTPYTAKNQRITPTASASTPPDTPCGRVRNKHGRSAFFQLNPPESGGVWRYTSVGVSARGGRGRCPYFR